MTIKETANQLLMKLFHQIPPEEAHMITIKALQLGLTPAFKERSDLSFTLFGKKIRNPIGLAGGADKEAAALAGWSKMGFGMVEAGTVTLHARSGNPQPRIWRLPHIHSVVNWLGLPGHGLDVFVKNLAAFNNHPARKKLFLGASIASPEGNLDDFNILATAVAPYVDYITLNASCPNLAHPAQHANQSPEQVAARQIKSARDGAGNIPVLVKLGPTKDKTALELMVKTVMAAGVDGFVATNTVPFASASLLHDRTFYWPKHDGMEVGGFSGPQLLEISCWMVREIRALVGDAVPIIGVGGVQSGADAQRLLQSGANAIQLYTGLVYHGPALVQTIADVLARP